MSVYAARCADHDVPDQGNRRPQRVQCSDSAVLRGDRAAAHCRPHARRISDLRRRAPWHRLAFIARAKQLGCTLDEINDLNDSLGGRPMRPDPGPATGLGGRTRWPLPTHQISDIDGAARPISGALATALERHRPEGACDDTVRMPDRANELRRVGGGVDIQAEAVTESEAPIACTLGPSSLGGRLDEWRQVLAARSARHRSTMASGSSSRLTSRRRARADWWSPSTSAANSSVLDPVDRRGLALEVRAPADAQSIVQALFGTPL